MEIKEEWKTIEGYENYQISSLGRVKSLNYGRTGKEKIIGIHKDKKGYIIYRLYRNGEIQQYKAHRLVASAFIPNPNNLPQVNHKDENKQNNCASNLEWCDAKHNNNYGTRNERVSKSHKGVRLSKEHIENSAKARQKPIIQLSLNGEFIKQWNSAKQAGKELNINASNFTNCCRGKHNSAGKYKWKYLSDYINEQIQYLNELKAYRDRLNDILKKAS